jgi:hypothetical protein
VLRSVAIRFADLERFREFLCPGGRDTFRHYQTVAQVVGGKRALVAFRCPRRPGLPCCFEQFERTLKETPRG